MDPSKTPPFGAKIKNSINRGHAEYVQVIHTSKIVAITDQLGDVDIYIKGKSDSSFLDSIVENHQLAVEIHFAVATKSIFLVAQEKGNGTMIHKNSESFVEPTPKANECIVGIYGKKGQNSEKRKKLSVVLNEWNFNDIIGHTRRHIYNFDQEILDDLRKSIVLFRESQTSSGSTSADEKIDDSFKNGSE